MKIKDILSALMAGIFIGLGGICFILSKANLVNGALWGALIFPIGLYLICVLKINLFTGKIGYALDDDSLTPIRLIVMLIFNFIGAAIVGFSCRVIFSSSDDILKVVETVASNKTNLGGIKVVIFLLKSVLCGMLVYLAVYLFKKSESDFAKFISVLIPIFIFVYVGFEHCIADMFYFTFAMEFSLQFVIAIVVSVLGNSIGAILLNTIFKAINKENVG